MLSFRSSDFGLEWLLTLVTVLDQCSAMKWWLHLEWRAASIITLSSKLMLTPRVTLSLNNNAQLYNEAKRIMMKNKTQLYYNFGHSDRNTHKNIFPIYSTKIILMNKQQKHKSLKKIWEDPEKTFIMKLKMIEDKPTSSKYFISSPLLFFSSFEILFRETTHLATSTFSFMQREHNS